jgi:hypothetical protein
MQKTQEGTKSALILFMGGAVPIPVLRVGGLFLDPMLKDRRIKTPLATHLETRQMSILNEPIDRGGGYAEILGDLINAETVFFQFFLKGFL